MKNDGWFAKTGPGMVALVEGGDAIFCFHAHLDQPHVVLFAQRVKGEDGPQDRGGGDADKDGSVNTASDDNPTRGRDEQIQGRCVYLTNQGGRRNRKER